MDRKSRSLQEKYQNAMEHYKQLRNQDGGTMYGGTALTIEDKLNSKTIIEKLTAALTPAATYPEQIKTLYDSMIKLQVDSEMTSEKVNNTLNEVIINANTLFDVTLEKDGNGNVQLKGTPPSS